MKHSFPHDLEMDLARLATQRAIQSYTERFAKYNPQVSWRDQNNATVTFDAAGVKFSGFFALTSSAIEVTMNVPFYLRVFRNKAIEVIGQQINYWVEQVRSEAGG